MHFSDSGLLGKLTAINKATYADVERARMVDHILTALLDKRSSGWCDKYDMRTSMPQAMVGDLIGYGSFSGFSVVSVDDVNRYLHG